MVDPSVMREIEKNPALRMHDREDELKVVKGFLAYDEEGNAYIDYLRVVLGESEDPDWVLRQHDQFIKSIPANIGIWTLLIRHSHRKTIKSSSIGVSRSPKERGNRQSDH